MKICANCGISHPIEDMYQAEGDWLCRDCADRLTLVCDHCGERIYQNGRNINHPRRDDGHRPAGRDSVGRRLNEKVPA